MKTFESLSTALGIYADTLDAQLIDDIRSQSSALENNLNAAREEGRNLRIAVIGQMKAGKSSFLNAAFFGRDLLPKADTPMTAALTKIVYAPQAKAEVVFYSTDDWRGIENLAQDYDRQYAEIERRLMAEQSPQKNLGPFAKPQPPRKPFAEEVLRHMPLAVTASRELVDKARQQGLNPTDYLGKTHTLDHVAGAAHLAQAMHDYVGSQGRFTAMTKMSVLYVDDPRLEGLEIIDTPGFNDPVVSRGQITRGFLGQSDVIFLLSNTGQFLTAADMSVLREQLPEAGIDDKAIFLVGSQRDMALRQDRQIAQKAAKLAERAPLPQRDAARTSAMIQLLDKKLGDLAEQTLKTQIELPGMDEKTRLVLGAVHKTKPRFISSWAWMVAEQFDRLSADDRYHLHELERATGYKFSPESLRQLSNIPSVRDELLAQRRRKDELLANKERQLIKGATDGVRDRLIKMQNDLINRSEKIRSGNISELKKIEQLMIQRMESGKERLEDIFHRQFKKAKDKFILLKIDTGIESQQYGKIDPIKEQTTESYVVSTSKWYNPFSWGDTETIYRDVVTIYASAQDAIGNLEYFAIQSAESLQKAILDCVNLEELHQEMIRAAMSLFDTSDADFDAELMLAEVNKSLRRITIPNVEFGKKDYAAAIVSSFGSDRVAEDQINGLKKAQRDAMKIILTDLEAEVDDKIATIGASLERTSQTFVTRMTRDIRDSLAKLRSDIDNKEQSLLRIEKIKAILVEQLIALDASATPA